MKTLIIHNYYIEKIIDQHIYGSEESITLLQGVKKHFLPWDETDLWEWAVNIYTNTEIGIMHPFFELKLDFGMYVFQISCRQTLQKVDNFISLQN